MCLESVFSIFDVEVGSFLPNSQRGVFFSALIEGSNIYIMCVCLRCFDVGTLAGFVIRKVVEVKTFRLNPVWRYSDCVLMARECT